MSKKVKVERKADVSRQTGSLNVFKWLVALLLLGVAFAANAYYASTAWAIRLAIGIVWMALVLGILAITSQGVAARVFARQARAELRKVVWPTKQETMQTTLMVVVVVLLTALVLWALDGLLLSLIGFVIGQKG
jgi:preprotein translocase subunit SecE